MIHVDVLQNVGSVCISVCLSKLFDHSIILLFYPCNRNSNICFLTDITNIFNIQFFNHITEGGFEVRVCDISHCIMCIISHTIACSMQNSISNMPVFLWTLSSHLWAGRPRSQANHQAHLSPSCSQPKSFIHCCL